MQLTSLVSRVYLGFFLLIAIMLGSAWFSIQGNQEVTSRIESITQQSTPMMVRSAELTISFLNINRSVSPYLSAMYIDELDPLRMDIEANIEQYQQRLAWFDELARSNRDISTAVEDIKQTSNQVLEALTALLETNIKYLDTKDQDLYSQTQFQQLAGQLSSSLVKALASAQPNEQVAIEAVLSQVSLLVGDVNEVFSLQDMVELRSVERSFNGRKERFDTALTDLKALSQPIYSRLNQPLKLFEQQVFTNKGAVTLHVEAARINEELNEQRIALESLIDVELEHIDVLSSYAASVGHEMYVESTEQSHQTLITLFIISAISVVLAIFIGINIANMIRRPAKLVNLALDRVAEKDLSARVEYKGDNEFGLLATKVNLVIDHLSEMITQIKTSSEQLNEASLENQSTSGDLNVAIDEQTAQTIQVATALEQIESSVAEIAQSANSTLSLVTDAVSNSTSGQALMGDNVAIINQLSEKLTASTQTIHQVEQESSSIETILDVITGISDQTNLLALNAAIEAARAGEQGRGFSVVADEVRMLAGKTSQSTQEIKQKIDQLQESSNLAVSQINECVDYMASCISQADGVNSSLQNVHQLLNQVEDRSHQIASATTEHQSVAQEVAQNVSQIHSLAEQNTERSKQLAMHGEQLEKMAETQSELTSTFKLYEEEDVDFDVDSEQFKAG
ncbi:methyl-accepting chemotaxis protein [Vibrio sp. ZSDE26]|uniref:Methyl-accepting chemotaxis protein n=1 Tax=Vibrio amylolyticus TaxID=2847292 RepID=A0A9X2BIF4_9VIBR|nr:methyl-accepting chemotaxis protein [Vibrio amylolyticus]MCK6264050.1 methyl-accepting chemotaxis protein [Vibrio amylolyticus]